MSFELSDNGEGIRFAGVLEILLPGTDGAVVVYKGHGWGDSLNIYFQPRTGLFLWGLAEIELCRECGGYETLRAFGSGDKAAAAQAITQAVDADLLLNLYAVEVLDALEAFEPPACDSLPAACCWEDVPASDRRPCRLTEEAARILGRHASTPSD